MWTPLNEAISYGNREMGKLVVVLFKKNVESFILFIQVSYSILNLILCLQDTRLARWTFGRC